ncbi:MAG: alpha/beta hydrolase [Acidimicrobiales bacterium]
MRVLRATGMSLMAAIVAVPLLSACGGPPGLMGSESSFTYCDNGGIAETLNVYEPSPPPRSAPAVVDIHGGGWVSGDANLQPQTVDWDVEPALVGKGWVFVSINYRLAPSSPWPAQLEDAKCAIRFLRANAPALHIDPSRIGVIGASAGGQLASMLGLTGQPSEAGQFEEGRYLSQSSAVEAVVDEYGPTDLTSPDWSSSRYLEILSKETFGEEVGQQSPALVAASPVASIHPGAPPFLVIQGAEDKIVPPSQSTELVRRLEKAGDVATLVTVQHAGHGLVQTGQGPVTPDVASLASEVVGFLTRQLSGPR